MGMRRCWALQIQPDVVLMDIIMPRLSGIEPIGKNACFLKVVPYQAASGSSNENASRSWDPGTVKQHRLSYWPRRNTIARS